MNTFGKYLISEKRNLYERAAQEAIQFIFPRIKNVLLKENPPKEETIEFSVNQTFPKLVYSTISFLKIIIERTDRKIVGTKAKYSIDNELSSNTNGTIKIELLVPSQFNDRDLETVYHKLTDVLRHELEHVAQIDRGSSIENKFQNIMNIDSRFTPIKSSSKEKKIDMEEFNRKMGYLNSPDEIEAWASSIYLNAKKRRESFTDSLNQTIYSFFSTNNRAQFHEKLDSLKPENRNIIMLQLHNWRRNITNYAKARYPRIIL